MTKIVIFGTGGLSRTVAHYIKHDDRYSMVGYTVDREYMEETVLDSLPVVPLDSLSEFISPEECKLLVVLTLQRVPNRILDKHKCEEIRKMGYSLFSYVSRDAIVSPGVSIGENVVISPGVIVDPFTNIGDGVIVRTMAYIGHNNILGEYCYIAPRASLSGDVKVEPHAFIGNNATLRGNITVGRDAVVGAGTTILKDVDAEAIIKAPANTILPVNRDKIKLN